MSRLSLADNGETFFYISRIAETSQITNFIMLLVSVRYQKHYEIGYLTCRCNLLNKCCAVIKNICRVCHWPIMEKPSFTSAE